MIIVIVSIDFYRFSIKINDVIYVKMLRAQLTYGKCSINIQMFTISLYTLVGTF